MGKGKNVLTMMIVFVFIVTASTILHGFDEKHVQALKKTNNCPKCDLSGAKLNDLDLSYADLRRANLLGADLRGSTLESAFFNTETRLPDGNFWTPTTDLEQFLDE